MDISIIIINWKSKDYLQKCLVSIYQYTSSIQFEVIVVDNASFDGSGDMLATEFPQVRFIQSEHNLGFSKGNSLAVAHARGHILLFLNPDTEMRTNSINSLYDAVVSLPNAGVAGARLLNSDGSLQTSCLQAFPTIVNQLFDAKLLRQWFPRAEIWGTAPLYTLAQRPLPAQGISGACIMTPRAVFERVGGFSEDYFMYFEDIDYCLKCVRAGLTNYYVPNAVVVHHGGKSSGSAASNFSSVMMMESAWRFFRKQNGRGVAQLFRLVLAVNAIFRLLLVSVAFPLVRNKARSRLRHSFTKWKSVARWAFGAESWSAEY